jgi:hypothetical protein
MAEKLNLASTGSKANVLLTPNPWPGPPGEEQLFTLCASVLRAETAAQLRETSVKTSMPLLNCISKEINMKGAECVAALEMQHYLFRLRSDGMRIATRQLEFLQAEKGVTVERCKEVRGADAGGKLSLAQRVDQAIKKAALPAEASDVERQGTDDDGTDVEFERTATDAEEGGSDTDKEANADGWQTMQLGVYGNQTTLAKVMRRDGSQEAHMQKWADRLATIAAAGAVVIFGQCVRRQRRWRGGDGCCCRVRW